jgi:hypothetical protein
MQEHVEFVGGVPSERGGLEHVDGVLPEYRQECRWTLCYLNMTRNSWMMINMYTAKSMWTLN